MTAWRYLVVESDKAPRELWLRALVQMPLPIAAITDSGGKSIHVVVRIDAGSKQEFDDLVRGEYAPTLVRLGADPGALTALRLTRLGNCFRGPNLQELLYLDDHPSNCPIADRQPRPVSRATTPKDLAVSRLEKGPRDKRDKCLAIRAKCTPSPLFLSRLSRLDKTRRADANRLP